MINNLEFDLVNIRQRARAQMEKGAVTGANTSNVNHVIGVLNQALATEIVCVLRYKMHAVAAQGIEFSEARTEFEEHANDELSHLSLLADRINQLGGKPNFNPDGLLARSASQWKAQCDPALR